MMYMLADFVGVSRRTPVSPKLLCRISTEFRVRYHVYGNQEISLDHSLNTRFIPSEQLFLQHVSCTEYDTLGVMLYSLEEVL